MPIFSSAMIQARAPARGRAGMRGILSAFEDGDDDMRSNPLQFFGDITYHGGR